MFTHFLISNLDIRLYIGQSETEFESLKLNNISIFVDKKVCTIFGPKY
jgi:hypothetical protein